MGGSQSGYCCGFKVSAELAESAGTPAVKSPPPTPDISPSSIPQIDLPKFTLDAVEDIVDLKIEIAKPKKLSELLDSATVWNEVPKFALPQWIFAKVLQAYDGDTLYAVIPWNNNISAIKIRLYYSIGYIVNAAEVRTRDTEEKKRGLAAKEFVAERINKKHVLLHTHGFDDFGRVLARVYYGSHVNVDAPITSIDVTKCNDLVDEIVKANHAQVYQHGKCKS